MNARKIIAIIFVCALIVSMAACNRSNNQQSNSLAGNNPNTAGAGTDLTPDESLPDDMDEGSKVEVDSTAGRHEFSDDNVTIDLSLDREDYTIRDIIGLNVTIHNKAETPVVFQKGSGSNRVPDGLHVTLGGLTSMYTPSIMTMDMQYEHILPGESVTFELPFAPYLANEDGMIGPDLDETLDWFLDNDDYYPVESGSVDGTLTFTYQLMEDDSVEGPYNELSEDGNPHVISGNFSTNIIEAE